MSDISHKFTMSVPQLEYFLGKTKDLLSIDNELLMKIQKDKTLLYSIVGEKMNVNAFKSFIIETNEIFSFKDDFEGEIRFIITEGKKFNNTLRHYLDYDKALSCEFFMNDDTYADNLKLKNKVLRLSFTGGDVRGMNTTIDIEKINNTLNKDNIDFKFELSQETFDKIKKISAVDNENDILTLNIYENNLSIGENSWDIKICEIEHEDLSITFPKKYFKSITFTEDTIDVFVFDIFLLIDNLNTNLLIALELTV